MDKADKMYQTAGRLSPGLISCNYRSILKSDMPFFSPPAMPRRKSTKGKKSDQADPPPTSRRRSRRRQVSSSPSPDPIIAKDETDRNKVEGPVEDLVAPEMRRSWAIQQNYPMCVLFDYVNPVRVFKRGTEFDDSAESPFADYDPKDTGDITETDENGVAQQYNPLEYMCVQSITSTFYMN